LLSFGKVTFKEFVGSSS